MVRTTLAGVLVAEAPCSVVLLLLLIAVPMVVGTLSNSATQSQEDVAWGCFGAIVVVCIVIGSVAWAVKNPAGAVLVGIICSPLWIGGIVWLVRNQGEATAGGADENQAQEATDLTDWLVPTRGPHVPDRLTPPTMSVLEQARGVQRPPVGGESSTEVEGSENPEDPERALARYHALRGPTPNRTDMERVGDSVIVLSRIPPKGWESTRWTLDLVLLSRPEGSADRNVHLGEVIHFGNYWNGFDPDGNEIVFAATRASAATQMLMAYRGGQDLSP